MNEVSDNMDDPDREPLRTDDQRGCDADVKGIASSRTGCWSVGVLVCFGILLAIILPLRHSGGEPVFNLVLVEKIDNQRYGNVQESYDVRLDASEENSASEAEPLADDESGISFITRLSVERDDIGVSVSLTSRDSRILEHSSMGILPRIGPNGERADNIYTRPFVFPAKHLSRQVGYIAIVVGSLGINESVTSKAIEQLPPEVTLAFAPYGHDLQNRVNQAIQHGHEILLQLPMEPFGYPDKDPGPHTLLTGGHVVDNLDKLHWLMSRFTGYFGVINYMGGKFVISSKDLRPILQEVSLRGLAFIDDGSSSRSLLPSISVNVGIKSYSSDLVLDAGKSESDLLKALRDLEAVAIHRGYAIGSATALPNTISKLSEWLSDLSARGFTLIPVSAISRFEADK